MSRRRNDDEQEFGSDSFLDIIANIVGILIILIVIAGVKVARQQAQPEVAQPQQAAAQVDDEAAPSLFIPGLNSDSADSPVNQAIASLDEPPESDAATESGEELDREIVELSLRLEQAQETSATTEAELHQLLALLQKQQQDADLQNLRLSGLSDRKTELTTNVFQLQRSLLTADEKASSFHTTLTSLNKRQTYVHSALQQVAEETRRLKEVLETNESLQSKGDRLHHRLSPVAEAAVDEELHFRLSAGRIAHVPLPLLLERLKAQVAARRNVVMKFHRYEGLVGPVEGFRMKYLVQRRSVSPLESLRYGENAFHMSVARWTILPAETLEAEPVDAALRIGSRFRQILERSVPDTVVTVWLYPNDFQHFHRLREFAHGLNLRVAARPLPEGTEIAGSPNGSRSSSQ